MSDPVEETAKRLLIAQRKAEELRDISLGIILVGSVAYSPNFQVNEKSDLDMIVLVDRLKATLPIFIEEEAERTALERRYFEGYCLKNMEDGVPISIHVLTRDAFDIISKCFVADIRVYRSMAKDESYVLHGFGDNRYRYTIKNIPLSDLHGVRTIVPVSFIAQDRYHLGVHRDKLLSNAQILFERDDFVSRGIDKLWSVVAENLCDESRRLYGNLDINSMNVLNALSRSHKMSEDVRAEITRKTQHYLGRIR